MASIKPLRARITAALARRHIAEALRASAELLERGADNSENWHIAAHAALLAGKIPLALTRAIRASELAPTDLTLRSHLALIHASAGQSEQALGLIKELSTRKLEPVSAGFLGNACSKLEDHANAEHFFTVATAGAAPSPELLYNLAMSQRFLGKLKECEVSLDETLRISPGHAQAQLARANLRSALTENNHVDEIRRLLASTEAWRDRVMLQFALGKELEDLKCWEQSFKHYYNGCKLQRSHIDYSPADELDAMEHLRRTADRLRRQPAAGVSSSDQPKPVFIMGLPRTGTTLVERIIASHPEVESLGELNDFAASLVVETRRHFGQRASNRRELIECSLDMDPAVIGTAYLQSLKDRRPEKTIIIDKMPINFLYLGLICCALPQASVIHVTRHPVDSCFAIFKTLFNQAYPWSYDLSEIANYYVGYHRLMAAWEEVFADRIHSVAYEELVNAPRQQTEKLLAHCGLNWSDECMDFHQLSAATTTASASQVRKPIYSSSIGKWRHYETGLTPVLEALQAEGIHY